MYIHLWPELWKHLRLFSSSHLIHSNSFIYLFNYALSDIFEYFLFTNIVVKCHFCIFLCTFI